jgi:hypothetical protein
MFTQESDQIRVKLFGVRFICEVKSWRPLIIVYGYIKKGEQ